VAKGLHDCVQWQLTFKAGLNSFVMLYDPVEAASTENRQEKNVMSTTNNTANFHQVAIYKYDEWQFSCVHA
jgi:hypothetical protein